MRARSFFRSLERSMKKVSKRNLDKSNCLLLLNTSTDTKILEELKAQNYIYQLVEKDLVKKDTVVIVPLQTEQPTIGFLKKESK